MIPDHANPIRVPPPIGPPLLFTGSRGLVLTALLRMGFSHDCIRLEALACNPMKYRVMTTFGVSSGILQPGIVGEGSSWAAALASFREMHERFRDVLGRVEGLSDARSAARKFDSKDCLVCGRERPAFLDDDDDDDDDDDACHSCMCARKDALAPR